MSFPSYSIVIPAYNEARRIPATLESVIACIRSRAGRRKSWSSNDGSRDSTAEVVRAFAAHAPEVRLIENPGNHGKGYSVRNGILQALGEVVMFTDADLSAPMEEAQGLFDAIAAGADIAIGSRWLERQRQTVRQPFYRRFFGRCFNAVTRMVMRPALRRYAVRLQGFYARRRANRLSAPDHRGLGLRSGDPVYRAQARLRHRRGSGELGPRRAHAISYLRDGARMLQTSGRRALECAAWPLRRR